MANPVKKMSFTNDFSFTLIHFLLKKYSKPKNSITTNTPEKIHKRGKILSIKIAEQAINNIKYKKMAR